jgi:predicted permease
VGAIATPLVRTVVALALLQVIPLSDLQAGVLLLFAVLPPAVFNYLLADRFGRDPEKVASFVMAGHVASIVFLPLALLVALR